MPLAGNDSISTGRSSRAEVQLGPGNLVRLNEETRLRIVDAGNRSFWGPSLGFGFGYQGFGGGLGYRDINYGGFYRSRFVIGGVIGRGGGYRGGRRSPAKSNIFPQHTLIQRRHCHAAIEPGKLAIPF